MTGAAIYYHPESHQAGGGESCNPESRMDVLILSLMAVPHLSLSRGSCKPTDEYPLSALGGHHGARISGAVASRTIGLGTSRWLNPLNGVHIASELAVVLQVQVCMHVRTYVCDMIV